LIYTKKRFEIKEELINEIIKEKDANLGNTQNANKSNSLNKLFSVKEFGLGKRILDKTELIKENLKE